MQKFCIIVSFLMLSLAISAAPISLTGDSVHIEDLTIDKPNFYVTIFTHSSSAKYEVNIDVWPEKAYVIGSFSAKDGSIYYYNSGLIKGTSTYYDCMSDSKVELNIRQVNADTCALSATIQASRNGSSYTYQIGEFHFAYKAGGEPDDPLVDPYRFEPTTPVAFTFEGDVVECRNRLDEGFVEVTLNEMADETYNWVQLYWATDEFRMPQGTYTFSADSADGTFLASAGYVRKNDQPSYVAIRGDKEDWGQYTPYYIIGGTLRFDLNAAGDTVFVTGQVQSKNNSVIQINVRSYNMFYEPENKPRDPETKEFAMDTVVITYLRNESDTLNHKHLYTFDFSQSLDYPNLMFDLWLPEPNALKEGSYTMADGSIEGLLLFQNQDEFETFFFGGVPYVFNTATLTLSQEQDSVWKYVMTVTDTVGSQYSFTMIQNPHIIIYPSLEPEIPEEDRPYIGESREQQTKEITFQSMVWDNSSVDKDAVVDIYLEGTSPNSDGKVVAARLGMFVDSKTIQEGTYPINSTDANNTFCASMGTIATVDIPCYVVEMDQVMLTVQIWYLVAGDISISLPDNRIVLEGNTTSYFGSTVKFRYEGINPTTNLSLPGASSNPTKILRHQQIEIIRNGKRYDLMGREL